MNRSTLLSVIRFSFFSYLISFSVLLLGQDRPKWTDNIQRENVFPPDQYYIGYNSSDFKKGEDIPTITQYVESLARNELSEVLYQSVNSAAQIRGDYPKSSFTRTTMEACGMETQSFIDEKEGVAFGVASVPIRSMKTFFYKKLSTEMDEIEGKIETANRISNKGAAYSRFMELLNELDHINSDRLLMRNLGVTNEVALMTARWEGYKNFVEDRAEELRNVKEITMQEAAFFMIEKLVSEQNLEDLVIKLQPPTYKSSEIATEFSLRFNQLLSYDLLKKGVKVRTGNASDATKVLAGTYWPRVDKIQVSMDLVEDFGDGMDLTIASGAVYVPIAAVDEENLHYEVATSSRALQKNVLLMNRITNGGMDAEVSTQKGSEALVFEEGEKLELFIEVNRPSYVRLLNVWSDEQQLLLMDNYYIDEENINKKIPLPFEWVTACPCGTEYIQLFARSEPFEYLEIETEDGFDFVTEALEETVNKSRGYQMVKKPGSYIAESTIVVTTLEKKE
ncbi:MAG: DUF4384 domain-containing protein [Bacteroidota bacterium]